MAATFTPNDAYAEAKIYMRNMPLQDVHYRILTDALQMIWMADAWRWTIGSLTNFNLTTDTQDYPYAGSLSTYLYTWRAYASDGNTIQRLHVDPDLPTTAVIAAGLPTHICKVPGAATFRVFPRPGSQGTTYTVIQQFKKIAPIITSGNLGTGGALVMDDEWFHVYFEAVVYWAMKYGFDGRAGTCQYNPVTKEKVYTGQLGVVMAGIDNMRQNEAIPVEWDYRPDANARRK